MANAANPKDYWSMSDQELERIAWSFKIPPLGRGGKDGEFWYVDRQYIIEQLLKRDRALREETPTNIMNIGEMHNSIAQQGTQDSSAQITIQNNDPALLDLLSRIKPLVDDPTISEGGREQLSSDIETAEAQLKAPHPKPGIIKECIHSMKLVLQGAVGHGMASGFVVELTKYLTAHHL